MRPLLHMSCNKFGNFSIDHMLSSPVLSKYVLFLSIDGFFLPTDFVYVMVSITLSSIISVIINSQVIQLWLVIKF